MSEEGLKKIAYAIGAIGFSALSLHYGSGWCAFVAVLCVLSLL